MSDILLLPCFEISITNKACSFQIIAAPSKLSTFLDSKTTRDLQVQPAAINHTVGHGLATCDPRLFTAFGHQYSLNNTICLSINGVLIKSIPSHAVFNKCISKCRPQEIHYKLCCLSVGWVWPSLPCAIHIYTDTGHNSVFSPWRLLCVSHLRNP